MDSNPLAFLIAGVLFLFLGLNGLRKREVYLGRLIRFIGPKMVMRGRIPVLIYGIGLSVGGVLALLTGIAELEGIELAVLEQAKLFSLILPIASFIFSVSWEFYCYLNDIGPYANVEAEVQDEEGSYRSLFQ